MPLMNAAIFAVSGRGRNYVIDSSVMIGWFIPLRNGGSVKRKMYS